MPQTRSKAPWVILAVAVVALFGTATWNVVQDNPQTVQIEAQISNLAIVKVLRFDNGVESVLAEDAYTTRYFTSVQMKPNEIALFTITATPVFDPKDTKSSRSAVTVKISVNGKERCRKPLTYYRGDAVVSVSCSTTVKG